uniref:Transcriptional repressor LexA n=1 Tax=candidate division WOR-3 bacterium TaxID=2052148 RepID=A0A7V1EGZ7_UNCW3
MKRKEHILKAIQDFLKDYGYPPTIREIAKVVGLKSTKAVKVHIDNLARDGLITKFGTKARGLRIEPKKLPIVGRVAAGTPELAFEEIEGYFNPLTWQDCFLLKVKGDSMINAHIYDGDLVVVRPEKSADDGDIIVANVDGETTIKRLKKANGNFFLKPENDSYPIIDKPFEIIGKVVGIVRKI